LYLLLPPECGYITGILTQPVSYTVGWTVHVEQRTVRIEKARIYAPQRGLARHVIPPMEDFGTEGT
jgi:hypothetical protein